MTIPILVTGAGGVGKTTVSAALGVSLARQGLETLVITVDPAKRLADALGVQNLGGEPDCESGTPQPVGRDAGLRCVLGRDRPTPR